MDVVELSESKQKETILPAWMIFSLEGRNKSIEREQIDDFFFFKTQGSNALHTFEGAYLNRQRT